MANSNQVGSFVPSSYIWDIQSVQQLPIDPGLKELLIRMYQNITQMALSLNISDKGMYQQSEFVNGQLLFPNPANNSSKSANAAQRQILRKVVVFPMLPNAGAAQQPHNITCTKTTSFTRIYGAASDQTNLLYRPIPYVDTAGADGISLSLDNTYVYITTQTNLSSFNVVYVILEYVQS